MKILISIIYFVILAGGLFLFYKGSKGYKFPTTIRERWFRSLQIGFAVSFLMYSGIFLYDLVNQAKFGLDEYIEMLLFLVPVGGVICTIALFISITSDEWRRNLTKSVKSNKKTADNNRPQG